MHLLKKIRLICILVSDLLSDTKPFMFRQLESVVEELPLMLNAEYFLVEAGRHQFPLLFSIFNSGGGESTYSG